MPRKSAIERFHAGYRISQINFYNGTPCWEWIRSLSTNGYSRLFSDGHLKQGHKFAYEHFVGPVPDGLTIDHLCRVTRCVNPDHLEAITMRVNALRGTGPTAVNAKKTHCIHGHELSGDNLYVYPDGGRECIACRTTYTNRWKASHPGYMKEYLRKWKSQHKK